MSAMTPDPQEALASQLETQLREYEQILEHISEGILVLDAQLKPVLANGAAKEMLGLREDVLPPRLPSEDLMRVARAASASGWSEELLNLWFPGSRTLKVTAARLGAGEQMLLTLQDVTEEQLAQRIRREFVAHASHELKSPVAGLQTLASAIKQALQDDPHTAERFSDRLVTEAERLARLINDLLDLSKLEDAGHIPEEVIDIAQIAQAEAEQVQPLLASKSMRFSSAIAPNLWVKGDRDQLGLMIRNLLDNAARYSGEGGSVMIEAIRTGDAIVVSVIDDGMGIPIDAQNRIFERFYRVDRARSRDRGGTGLGLAIVKHAAELHGGEVEVESELGRGSTFRIRLPALPADTPSGD